MYPETQESGLIILLIIFAITIGILYVIMRVLKAIHDEMLRKQAERMRDEYLQGKYPETFKGLGPKPKDK